VTETETLVDVRSDLPDALRLQALALALFDHATTAHQLPAHARRLLQQSAAYYRAARYTDGERPDRLGRDLVLAAPIPDLSPNEQVIVAGVVALQRTKVRPQREPVLLRLGGKERQLALGLAAILRLADALDDAPADSLHIHVDDDTVTLLVGGARGTEIVDHAGERADLWRDQIGAITIRVAELNELGSATLAVADGQHAGPAPELLLTVPEASDHAIGGEPIAEAARRQLRRFFDKLLAREDAVRDDKDIEDVHQMRVATRRIRASLQVVEDVYDPKLIRRCRRDLRRVARSLGTVRDGDVFLAHVLAYRDSLPAEAHAGLEPLIAAVRAERAQARARLLADLDAKRYTKFKQAFALFLTTPGADAAAPESGLTPRVRDYAGSAIWQRYEQWRAYETMLAGATDETLHQTRIAGKHLRYTLEFFADALGPHVDQVLSPLVELQECLGALQDVVTARAHVGALGLADDGGAQAYLAARDAEHAAQLADLPRKWEKVGSATYRRRLFELIVKL
jgi:CHAD domain-containing protein